MAPEVVPITIPQDSKVNFGAMVTGVDMNDLDEDSFLFLREAIYTHTLIVVKAQHNLLPIKQQEFVQRLDPDAMGQHGAGTTEEFKKLGGAISKRSVYSIPGADNVRLVGAGYQGANHYGLKDVTLKALSHSSMHASPLSPKQLAEGQTRFMGWHFDALLYGSNPSRVTVLRCIKAPRGPDLTIRWDDGSGLSMKCPPGGTAFLSGSQLYDLLDGAERDLVDNSRWEAGPHPFVWTGTRKHRSTGMGFVPGGDVVPLEKLPDWEEDKIQVFPMAWMNPVTRKKSVQIHPTCVRKLYLRRSPHAEERVVGDLEEIRVMLNGLMDKVLRPEYILIPPADEGDILVWNNWVPLI